ncbi:MAG: tyrosine-type recombinase/integrase [Syntrophobacteraceae bacterium]
MGLTDPLFEALWWWYQNRPDDIKSTPYVFVSVQTGNKGKKGRHYGQPFKYRRSFMQSICKRAGIEPAFGFHAMRRYVGSILIDKYKQPITVAQRIYRHKHLSTTDRYIGNVHSDLRTAMQLIGSGCNPKSLPNSLLADPSNDQGVTIDIATP